MAGPALMAACWPVRTKMPAPITPPMPRRVSEPGPSPRFRAWSPCSVAWASRTEIGFLAKSFITVEHPPPARVRTADVVRIDRG